MRADLMILIIDDDLDIHALLRFYFKKNGIETFHATTIQEAKSKISLTKPSIILLDNQLPDGTGIEIIPFLKEKAPKAMIIATTAYLPAPSRKLALEYGADFFLEKPFSCDQIKNLCMNYH